MDYVFVPPSSCMEQYTLLQSICYCCIHELGGLHINTTDELIKSNTDFLVLFIDKFGDKFEDKLLDR